MKSLTVEFEFEIGDIVVPRASAAEANDRSWLNNSVRYQIVKRWVEECPGGIQKLYTVMLIKSGGDIAKESITVNECVWRLSKPFDDKSHD